MTHRLPINIDALLHQRAVEGERIEYKSGWNRESVLHTLCAFANDFQNLGGGYIVIGVEEKDGQPILPPVGIEPASVDRIQKELVDLVHHAVQPYYHPLSAVYEVEGKTIFIVWAPGGETRPYKAKVSLAKEAKEWAYYIRKQSSTIRAKGDDERELLSLAAKVPFDDRYNQSALLKDLSPLLLLGFLREVGSDLAKDASILWTKGEPWPHKHLSRSELALDAGVLMETLGRQMNIIGGPPESPFPKNVSLLFFNEEPHRFFPATQIDVVWFPEGAGGDRFEEKIFQGPLGRITRDAINFVERSYLKETVVKHPERSEAERFWNFPRAAIEEAIVNAVYHRSYEEREPIEVRVSPEDLVVLSFPGPDRSIKMEDLRVGRAVSRRYRNRRIGEFLKELDLTEGRSTGIPKILKAMKENGSPPPEFESNEERTHFLIRLPVHSGGAAQPNQINPLGGKSEGQVGTKLGPSRDQVEVLRNMTEERSISQLMEVLGRTNRTKFRDQVLAPLIDLGLAEPTIPDKPKSSKQRYRLSAKGRDWLAKQGAGE